MMDLLTKGKKMKKLTVILASIGILISGNVLAKETTTLEQATEALIKQQKAALSLSINNQVSQDIYFAIRAMKLPKMDLAKDMLAKTQTNDAKDSE